MVIPTNPTVLFGANVNAAKFIGCFQNGHNNRVNKAVLHSKKRAAIVNYQNVLLSDIKK